MRSIKHVIYSLPGWLVSVLMILMAWLWTFWGTSEMYHEGWWGQWYNRFPYLLPVMVTALPALISFSYPVIGGSLLVLVGLFALFFFKSGVVIIGAIIVFIGAGFIIDAVIKRAIVVSAEDISWWQQYWRQALLLAGSCTIFLGVSVYNLPIVLSRKDDFIRSARLIEGNHVSLIWAPAGPGWNLKQPWGGYPSWESLALYGVPPLGFEGKPGQSQTSDVSETGIFASVDEMAHTNVCLFLNEDGTMLEDTIQRIWRMPTTDEVVRSLVRHGQNAGCQWQGTYAQTALCDVLPDKESPLWATDLPVIYYWTADEENNRNGVFVAYNGMVNATYKKGGNPRHGYRCVKDP